MLFSANFFGRRRGGITVCYPIAVPRIEADCREFAELTLYEKYRDISALLLLPIQGGTMDVVEEAVRVTRVYAQTEKGFDGFKPEQGDNRLSVVPGQVWILRLNDLIIEVCATEAKALDGAHVVMERHAGVWEEIIEKRRWAQDGSMATVWIAAHEVH